MNKGLLGKVSLFSLLIVILFIFTILFFLPANAAILPGDLTSLYGNSICGGNSPCSAWVNATRGDMFFADGNNVFIVANYSCSPPSACNQSMIVTGNFSSIGGSSNVVGVFKQNATNGAWAVFELNSTVNLSATSGSIAMTPETIFLNATDGNGNASSYNDAINATVLLVNMSVPPDCPPVGSQLPTAVPLLNGTVVNVINDCWTNCTVDDHAQYYNSTHYVLCGPLFGGSSTNFTDVAANGNFSNFHFVLDIPGEIKINFTQNVSLGTPQQAQAILQFAMDNIMAGGRIGINETEWNGADPTKPNLTLSAALTIYNFSGRFGLPSNRRPSIARRAVYETGSFSPCPPIICSGITWDGQDLTFTVTGFSEYSVETGLSIVLSNATGQNFNSTTNISYTNTRNVNFSYIPTWNSTVSPQAVRLWGNFTGAWAANVTNTTALTNATLNYINNTVGADGAYIWNAVINDTTGGNDTHVANWTIIVDTAGPTWFTNNSSSPTNYSSTLSLFNITWNDTTSPVSTVFITIRNSTGVLINNASMSNTYGGSIYNYSIVLPAGTFNWTSYANDTSGNWNSTSTWSFTISNGTVPLILSNNTSLSGTYPYSTNITGSGCPAQLTCTLYRNDTGSLGSASDLAQLGVGVYNYIYNTTGNQNYSTNSTSITLTISQGSTSAILYLNGSTSNQSSTYPNSTINVTAVSNVAGLYVTILRNGLLLQNTTSVATDITQWGVSNNTFTVQVLGNANYSSSAATTLWWNVSKGSTSIKLYMNGTEWADNETAEYPNSTNINATINVASLQASTILVRNTLAVSNPDERLNSLGVWNYTGYYDASENYTGSSVTRLLTVQDTTKPTWTSSNSTPTSYSTTNSSKLNVTWSDNVAIDKVFITIRNSTGVLINNASMSNTYGGSIYNYSIVLPAGTFNWTSYANDTSGNWNSTSTWSFTISNGTVPLILSNNTSLSGTYPYSTNITGSGCPAQLTCTLYRNDTGSLGSASDLAQLGVGVYNYTYNTSGNANYSANSTSIILAISKGTPDVKIFINDNPANTTINYSSTLTIKGNSSSGGVLPALFNISITNVTTTSQSVSISNTSQSSPIFLSPSIGNGTYRINLTYDGNSNWLSTYNDTIFLFVNKGTASLNVYIDGNASNETIAYPSTANITANESNGGDSDCVYTLWRNTTQLINGSDVWNYTSFGNGTYGPFKYNMSGTCSNWTLGTSSSYYLFVNKGTPTGSISGINVTLPTTTSITPSESNVGDADVNYTFWRDTSLVSLANGTTSLSADTTPSTAGTYTYMLNSTAGENWTSNSSITTSVITVSAASSSSPSGGSSSIGGITGTGMISYITLAVGKANISANYLTTGGKLIANIARYQDVAFRGMNVTVVNNVLNIRIMISKLPSLPSSVSYDISGKVYNYISVGEQNFTDADIKSVNISFAVNKTWLTNNNVDASNITLYRWANNRWNDLNAVKVSDNGNEVFFTASSPGLSIFIIGTKGGAPVVTPAQTTTCIESWSCTDWSTCANNQQTRTCTDANNCGTVASEPSDLQSCTVSTQTETTVEAPVQTSILTTVIVIVIAIIACVFIFLERANISSRLKKFDKKYDNNKKTSYLVEDDEEEKFKDI